MSEYVFKISSPFPCMLKVNQIEKILSNPYEYLLLKICDEKFFTIYCYPTNSDYLEQKNIPFAVNINTNDLKKSNTEQVEITTFKSNIVFLTLKPFLIPKTFTLKTQKQNLTVLNKSLDATLSIGKPTIFSLNFGDNIFYKTLKTTCTSFKATAKGNFLFIEFHTTPKQILVLDCKNENKILDDCEIDTIEYSKNKVFFHTPIYDISKHGKLVEYDLTSNKRTESLTYANKKPVLEMKQELIPYIFFEALKIKNLKLCRYYLDETLSKELSDEHLTKYFGNFLEVVPSPKKDFNQNCICLIYKDDNIFTTKEFQVELTKNKIKNIISKE